MNLSIEKIENGILLTKRWGATIFCKNTEELFDQLLLELDGKSSWFGRDSYGYVHIFYKPEDTFTSPPQEEPV